MVAAFNLSNIYTCAVFLICPNHSASRSAVSKPNYILLGHDIRILCGTKRWILSTIISLKLFQISSTQLPLLAHDANSTLRKLYRPGTVVLWYTGTNLSTWSSWQFSPRKGHLSPGHYCKRWTHFRAEKVNVQQSILSGSAIYYLSVTFFPYQSI